MESELVSHSGEYAAGTFLHTIYTVDLATGWPERVPLLGKGQPGVLTGLDGIRQQLPFRLRGHHPDTGSEFIHLNLFNYCREREIAFTRSRAYHKNHNCHVEQKNWPLVRRLLGYDPLDTPGQQAWLDAFYTDDLRPFANCFQPYMKLVGKKSVGQRTRRIYDTPKTPMGRLLDEYPTYLEFNRIQALTGLYSSISPLTLK